MGYNKNSINVQRVEAEKEVEGDTEPESPRKRDPEALPRVPGTEAGGDPLCGHPVDSKAVQDDTGQKEDEGKQVFDQERQK